MNDIRRLFLILLAVIAFISVIFVAPNVCYAAGGINLYVVAPNNSNGEPAISGSSVKVSYYRSGQSNPWWCQNWDLVNIFFEHQPGQSFTPDANFTLGAIAVRTGKPFVSIPPDSGKAFSNLEGKHYKIHIFTMDDANDYTPDLPADTIAEFNDVIPAGIEDALGEDGWDWVLFELPQPTGVDFQAGQCYGFLFELTGVCSFCHGSMAYTREYDDPFAGGRGFLRNITYSAVNDWEGYQESMEFMIIDDAMDIIACGGQDGDVDGDCEVTFDDYIILANSWLNSTATAPF